MLRWVCIRLPASTGVRFDPRGAASAHGLLSRLPTNREQTAISRHDVCQRSSYGQTYPICVAGDQDDANVIDDRR